VEELREAAPEVAESAAEEEATLPVEPVPEEAAEEIEPSS
jgi:hypothetical protein